MLTNVNLPSLQEVEVEGYLSLQELLGVEGFYQCNHFNFELKFRNNKQIFELDYPKFNDEFNCYGVCDSPQQLLVSLPNEVLTGPKKYVISMTQLLKENQNSGGGWRWHKWGPYIGMQNPQCEYLYDEPNIKEVWVYHIYQIE